MRKDFLRRGKQSGQGSRAEGEHGREAMRRPGCLEQHRGLECQDRGPEVWEKLGRTHSGSAGSREVRWGLMT